MPKGGGLAISPVVEVEGKRLNLSNLDKVLYPASGFTKGQVIDYYARIAPALLPHLQGRPVTMKRYPDGVDSEYFYEKNAPKNRPDWVQTAPVWSRHNRRHINYLLVEDLPTLTWCSIWIRGRLRILCSAARSGCGCGRFSSTGDCSAFRRRRGRRGCRCTCR